MSHRNLTGQRLAAIFMLGWLLFNFPLLALFAGATDWFDMPAAWLYLFTAWLLLIVLLACVVERASERQSRQDWPGKDLPPGASGMPATPDNRK